MSVVYTPMEYFKCNAQITKAQSVTYSSIYKKDGMKGIFRGHSAMVAREIPSWASYFYFYELFKHMAEVD